MGFYTKAAIRLFGELGEKISSFFPELKFELRRAKIRISIQEYLSKAMLTSFIVFLFELPLLSFIFGLIFRSFLFGFITSFTASFFLTIAFFLAFVNYPKTLIKQRAKEIDASLPFASLYLSTVAGSRLPLHKTLNVFSKFSRYGEVTKEITVITSDIEAFGIDVNTSLERAIERTPSKNLKELFWGVLSVNRTGGDLNIFLKEKARSFIAEYRRKLYEFSRQLTVFVEIYLTSIILGAIFFTILTSIMSGIAGTASNIVTIQFFLIFVFLPLVSLAFIILVRSITPGGE